jgi:hypothetical protein
MSSGAPSEILNAARRRPHLRSNGGHDGIRCANGQAGSSGSVDRAVSLMLCAVLARKMLVR